MRQIQIYRHVLTIARLGSIRRAAEVLAISPSALNRQIQALERDLGATLFDRTTTGVRLSVAGEVYFKVFRDHLAEMDRASHRVDDLFGQRRGDVRLGIGPELLSVFIGREVASYQQQFPLLNFSLNNTAYNEVTQKLNDGQLEAIIAVGVELGPGVTEIFAAEIPIVGITANDQHHADQLTFSDLAQSPLIVPTQRSGLRNLIDATFLGRKIHPHYLLEHDGPIDASLIKGQQAIWLAVEHNVDAQFVSHAGLTIRPLAPNILPTAYARFVGISGMRPSAALSGFLTRLQHRIEDPAG